MTGRVLGVAMVRDEADTIGHTLRHLASEGLDEVWLFDNQSTDGTLAAIDDAAADIDVHCLSDPDAAYYQSKKLTRLAAMAGRDGDWIIPFDADEIWHADQPLRQFLASFDATDVDVIEAPVRSYFETALDDPSIANPFLRLGWREPDTDELASDRYRRDLPWRT